MSIEVSVSGGGAFEGAKSNIASYSVTEESTPTEASDSSGSVGQINFSAVDDTSRFGSVLLLDSDITVTDTERGTVTGTVTGLSGNNGLVQVTASSKLSNLVIVKDANPVNGTFLNAITYYLSLGGITSGFTVDSSLSGLSVVAPGWREADLWTKIKELCVLVNAEVALIGGTITFRPIRGIETDTRLASSMQWDTTRGSMAQSVTVNYYNSEYKTNFLVYPEGGWNPDVEVYTVDAEETKVINIPVNMFLNSLEQPVVQNSVAPDYTASSVYSVVGGNGFNITAAQWTATGGKVSVAIGEDRTSIDLTLVGAGGPTTQYAPYRIALSSGSGVDYSTLRLRGTGMYFLEESVNVLTGANKDAQQDVGATVSNIFIRTFKDAYNAALKVAAKWASATRNISITVPRFDVVSGTAPQTIGYVAGSRVRWRRNVYRIRSATISSDSVNYTAEVDTTFNDFNASATGMTFNNFNSSFAGLTFDEFAQAPLPVVRPEYDEY